MKNIISVNSLKVFSTLLKRIKEIHDYLIITLKVVSYLSCLWRQKLKQSVPLVSGKLTTLGLFFVENKD